jgi:carbon-monoxide dehydrogenase large subunit
LKKSADGRVTPRTSIAQGSYGARSFAVRIPHARIVKINVSKARNVPGVKAIATGEHAEDWYIGKQIRDMLVLCRDVVRFVGDRVAAVAVETLDAAEQAVSLIDVVYEEVPAVFDPLEAIKAYGEEDAVGQPSERGAPWVLRNQ